MIPRHEVVEEGRGNAFLNRGPRQGELECQGSQRIQFGEPIVLNATSLQIIPAKVRIFSNLGRCGVNRA